MRNVGCGPYQSFEQAPTGLEKRRSDGQKANHLLKILNLCLRLAFLRQI